MLMRVLPIMPSILSSYAIANIEYIAHTYLGVSNASSESITLIQRLATNELNGT